MTIFSCFFLQKSWNFLLKTEHFVHYYNVAALVIRLSPPQRLLLLLVLVLVGFLVTFMNEFFYLVKYI